MPRWAIGLIIGGLVVVSLCAVGAVLFAINVKLAPRPSVRVESCTIQGPVTTIGYVVRNNDKAVHDYYVQGTVGGSAATPGVLRRIYPGETAAGRLDSFGQGDCRITRVDQR
jgi:hypothetical protein